MIANKRHKYRSNHKHNSETVWIKITLLISVIFLAGIIVFLNLIIKKENYLADKIYPNVYIDNINFGEKSQNDVIKFFEEKNNRLQKINITLNIENEISSILSGEKLKLRYDAKGIAERAFLIGRTSYMPSRFYQKIASIFNLSTFHINPNIEYDKDIVNEYITNLEDKYDKPAKNALFQFENGRVVSFKQEEKGIKINEEEVTSDFDKMTQGLKKNISNRKIIVKKIIIEPEITLASANNLGIEELIGEGRSNFSHSIPGRIHNVILASSKFNGVLIPKDKLFSFNENIGDISSLTGYQPAYIIKDGKTVLGDGGGVCQVSTTLFRASLNAGLLIEERSAHAYRVSYYENDSKPGFDATVFSPYADLKIKNNTPAYILIQTEIIKEDNILIFRLYGKKDNRRVEMTTPILYDQQPPPPDLYQDDPTLKKGVVKQVDFPAWGGKTNFNYRVIKDEKVIFEKNFFSSYRPWQAIYLVGTGD